MKELEREMKDIAHMWLERERLLPCVAEKKDALCAVCQWKVDSLTKLLKKVANDAH